MTFLRSWLLSVTACAVLVSIVQQLTDGGTMKKIVRFVGGMVLMLAMLRPLLSLRSICRSSTAVITARRSKR